MKKMCRASIMFSAWTVILLLAGSYAIAIQQLSLTNSEDILTTSSCILHENDRSRERELYHAVGVRDNDEGELELKFAQALSKRSDRGKYQVDDRQPKPSRSKSDPGSMIDNSKENPKHEVPSKGRSKSNASKRDSVVKILELERRGDTEPVTLQDIPNRDKSVSWALSTSQDHMIESTYSDKTNQNEVFDPQTLADIDGEVDEGPVDIPLANDTPFTESSEDIPPSSVSEDGDIPDMALSDDEEHSILSTSVPKKNFRSKAILHYKPTYEASSKEPANAESKDSTEKGNVIFLDVAAGRRLVEEDFSDQKQTASFKSKSQFSGSYAFGVADRLVDNERTVPKDSCMPEVLCSIAESTYAFSKAGMRAPVLLDNSFKRILGKETKVNGYVAAVFGVVTRYGKMTVSVLGNAGAVLYRKGRLHQTEVKINPEGEKYSMSPKPGDSKSDISKMEETFDSFTGKLNYECNTHSGDVWLFTSGDVMKFTKPAMFTELVERHHLDSAEELSNKFLEIVVTSIRDQQRKAEDAQLCSCFPCFRRKTPGIPTDVSLVIVKVL